MSADPALAEHGAWALSGASVASAIPGLVRLIAAGGFAAMPGSPPAEIADRARRLLAGATRVQAAVLGQALRSRPGPTAAANLLIAARDELAGRLRRRTLQPAAR